MFCVLFCVSAFVHAWPCYLKFLQLPETAAAAADDDDDYDDDNCAVVQKWLHLFILLQFIQMLTNFCNIWPTVD